mgnify:CR=1 FL=1
MKIKMLKKIKLRDLSSGILAVIFLLFFIAIGHGIELSDKLDKSEGHYECFVEKEVVITKVLEDDTLVGTSYIKFYFKKSPSEILFNEMNPNILTSQDGTKFKLRYISPYGFRVNNGEFSNHIIDIVEVEEQCPEGKEVWVRNK